MNCRENRYFLLAPRPTPWGGVRGETLKVTKHNEWGGRRREGEARAKPGNQLAIYNNYYQHYFFQVDFMPGFTYGDVI